MGIPSFVKYLKYNIENLTIKLNFIEKGFSNIYIDFNHILNNVLNKVELSGETPSEEEYAEIRGLIEYTLEAIVGLYKPTNLVYIAFDSSKPFAQLNHDRQTSAMTEYDSAFDFRHKQALAKKWKQQGLVVDDDISDYIQSSNRQIIHYYSLGTAFYAQISEYVQSVIIKLVNQGPLKDIRVVFSDDKIAGSPQYKIFDFLRSQSNQKTFDEDSNHLMISSDSDFIYQSIPLIKVNLYVGQSLPQKEETRGQDPNNLINIDSIRDNWYQKIVSEIEMEEKEEYIQNEIIVERIMHDFMLIFIFLGNNFIPQLPTLENKQKSMAFLVDSYKKYFKKSKFTPITTKEKYISLQKLQFFIHTLTNNELQQINYERSQYYQLQAKEGAEMEAKVDENAQKDKSTLTPLEIFKLDMDEFYFKNPKKPIDQVKEKFTQSVEKYNIIYYEEKFGQKYSSKFVQKVCQHYLEGIMFSFEYFARGCISWNWSYPFDYAPFPSDLQQAFNEFDFPSFEKGSQVSPLQYLLSYQSGMALQNNLPKPLQSITKVHQELAKYYPVELKLDQQGKMYFRQSIAQNLSLFNSEDFMGQYITQVEGDLTEEEKALNTVSKNARVFYKGDALGTEKKFNKKDYKKNGIVGIFQSINSIEGVSAYKFKYPAQTADELMSSLNKDDEFQQEEEEKQRLKYKEIQQQNQQQMAQTPCRFGETCKNLKTGTCRFFHSEEEIANKDQPKQRPCTKGESCPFFKRGTCKFYHPQQ